MYILNKNKGWTIKLFMAFVLFVTISVSREGNLVQEHLHEKIGQFGSRNEFSAATFNPKASKVHNFKTMRFPVIFVITCTIYMYTYR